MPMPSLTERDEALIADYLADALAPPQRAEVEQRLATEAAFAAEYRAQERLIALLRALPDRPAPRSFALSPQQAQAVPRVLLKPARLSRSAWWRWASAAALLLGGGVLLLFSNQRSEPVAQVAAAPTQLSIPAPTLTEADAAIMQLEAEMRVMETQTAASIAVDQRAMPAQALHLPPGNVGSAMPSQAVIPAAVPPARSAITEPQPQMGVILQAEQGVPAAEQGVPAAQAEMAIMSMPALSTTLAEALPRLLSALLRLLLSFLVSVSSTSGL